jgi:hypothetical protein
MLVLIGYALPARRRENSRYAAAIAVAPGKLPDLGQEAAGCPSRQPADYGQPAG